MIAMVEIPIPIAMPNMNQSSIIGWGLVTEKPLLPLLLGLKDQSQQRNQQRMRVRLLLFLRRSLVGALLSWFEPNYCSFPVIDCID